MATRTAQQRADAARRAASHPRENGRFIPRNQGSETDAGDAPPAPEDDGHGQGGSAGPEASSGSAEEAHEAAGDTGEEAAELTLVDQTVNDLDGPPEEEAHEEARGNRKRLGRGPGRPKGSKPTAMPKRAGPSRTANTTEKVVAAGKLDQKAVQTLLTICEGFMVPQLGDAARFAPNERQLIEPSLANILARMAPDQAAKFSAVADPLMLGTGVLMWALRVFNRPSQPAGVQRQPVQLRPVGGTAQPTTQTAPPAAGDSSPTPAAAAPDQLDAIQDAWSESI